MRHARTFLFVALLIAWLTGATTRANAEPPASNLNAIFARGNLTAWCIVPYDGKQRGPAERAEMLERIGIKQFAYDWRAQHLPSFEQELIELQKRNIRLTGVWFPDVLNDNAKLILSALAKHGLKTELWVMSRGYEKLGSDAERVNAAVERLTPIAAAAGELGCTLGIYNHNGWLGEPANMAVVAQRLKDAGHRNVGIVYNFSHAYLDLDGFAERFALMRPHLLAVNLNGMTKQPAGAKDAIVPVGQGQLDAQLLKVVRDSGFAGPIGIINESTEDAELRLLDNIAGLEWLLPQLDGRPAGPRPAMPSWREPTSEAR